MATGGHQVRGLLLSGRFPELEDALCERVAALRRGRPLAQLTIVVGSSHVRTHVSDLLVRSLGATANVSVVTLARLAADLVAAERGAPQPTLKGHVRERLVRRLVAACRLRYFAPIQERPHFPQALAATFADLREARVAPHSDWATIATGRGAAAEASLAARTGDLDGLYAAYCEQLEELGLADGAQLLVDAASAASTYGQACFPLILYGVYDLNRAQEALVRQLLREGADLFVPIPRGGSGKDANALEAGRAAGLIEQQREAPAALVDRDRLSRLWHAPGPIVGPGAQLRGDGTLCVISVPDERAEAREAARAVLSAAEAGAAFWDCAVVVPTGDDVERAAAGLQAAGIPVACRVPDRSPGPRLLLRLAACLAPRAGEPFARRAVIDLLGAAPLRDPPASPEATALWLDEARQAGVVGGLAHWGERLEHRCRGLARRVADLEASGRDLGGDDEVADKLDTVKLRLDAARGLAAAAGTLARACSGLPLRAGWSEWATALGGVAEALFDESAATAVRDAAARVAALGVLDEAVDVTEVAAALREQLADARTPVGRVGREGVAVITPLEVRGLRFHTVVFTGLAEGGFPSRGRPDPLLSDAERRRLAEAQDTRLPLAESRDAESTLLFAFACEAARENLTLLAPRTDAATGRPRLPSRLLLRLASLAAGRPVGLDEFLSGAPLAAVWRHVGGAPVFSAGTVWTDAGERDAAALLALPAPVSGPAAREYLGAVVGDPDSAARRLAQWRAARDPEPGAWDGLLGAEARAALASRHPFAAEMHPTRLERYVRCPFAFLLQDVLGLQAPEEPGDSLEMDPKEFGTLAHAILQRVYQDVIDGALALGPALAAVEAAWEVCCAAAEQRGVTGAVLSWQVRSATLREDLLEAVGRDPVFAAGGGRPSGVEWRFGEAVGRPVTLGLPAGRSVRFAGRVDRIDAIPSGARIVDYKTGKGGTEKDSMKKGLSAQLPVYQLALRQAGDEDYGEIACLYRLVTRRGGFADLSLEDDEEAAGRRLRGLVAEVVTLVDRGHFPRSPAGRCDYCDVAYACGVTDWTRMRKRAHDSLQALVDLQRSGPREVDDDAAV
jgi:ATP-dependent helicase/nuclease subunit B